MISQEKEIIEKFRRISSDLCRWGAYVDNKLKKSILICLEDKSAVQMEPAYRLKDEKSFLYKSLYRNKNYSNPLIDIEDKLGTRIVLLKSSDVLTVKNLVCESDAWVAKITKDIYQEIEDQPRNFDYQSLHIVVSPCDSSSDFDSTVRPYLTCEIQIRTLLQHAFAEISHDSSYKGPYKNDREILRNLSKSMALMEATDDYFCRIFEMMLDEERFFKNYMNQLKSIYSNLVPEKVDSSIDFFITEEIFGLLVKQEVQINDLTAFVSGNESHLIKIISNNKEAIFEQPVFLLIQYYFQKHRCFLTNEWPLSQESLKIVYRANNTSFEGC